MSDTPPAGLRAFGLRFNTPLITPVVGEKSRPHRIAQAREDREADVTRPVDLVREETRTVTVDKPAARPEVGTVADGKVKGEMLSRMWLTFRMRAQDRKVTSYLGDELVEQLYRGAWMANEWYPVEHYLALHRALRQASGSQEVVDTALESVIRGLKKGSWKVFMPVIAELAPEAFCAHLAKRFSLMWKHSFQPANVEVQVVEGGAKVTVDAAWCSDAAFQDAVRGSLLAIPSLVGLQGECDLDLVARTTLRAQLRWHRAPVEK